MGTPAGQASPPPAPQIPPGHTAEVSGAAGRPSAGQDPRKLDTVHGT